MACRADLYGTPSFQWGQSVSITTAKPVCRTVVADFDQDGLLDIAVATTMFAVVDTYFGQCK